MNLVGKDYRESLRRELVRRQNANPHYSLRAFARALKLNPTTLSLTLQGKRGLGEKSVQNVVGALGFDPDQARLFRSMVLAIDGATPEIRLRYSQELDAQLAAETNALELSASRFRVIADWYNLAILELLGVRAYRSVPAKDAAAWIGGQLGLSALQVKGALADLASLGLLEIRDGKPARLEGSLYTGDRLPSTAIRHHHRQYLEKSLAAIEEQAFEECDFSGIIVPADPGSLPEAKRAIQAFRKKMSRLLRGKRPEEVYRLSVSLFRVSQRRNIL